MGILDEKRYADNMTREEIAHALKHGHPLVADYLVADAGKQMQENDALVRILEQQAGVSGESITDKLAAYLDKPLKYATSPSEQVDTLGRIDKMPQGRLAGAGGPMPGPQGAGGPMPGPRVPGGAGGAMPGMQRGPQGAGALMRRGGIVGYQNQGLVQNDGYADELKAFGDEGLEQEYDDVFGPFDKPWVRGTDWLRPKSPLDYALLAASLGATASVAGAPAGITALGGYGVRKGAQVLGSQALKKGAQKWIPGMGEAVRRSIGSDAWKPGAGMVSKAWSMAKHPYRTLSGGIGSITPFGKTSIAELIGTPLARMSTKGGIRGRFSDLLTGGPDRLLKSLPAGARSTPVELFGQRGGARALIAAQLARMYGGDPLSEADIGDTTGTVVREFPERPGDPGAGAGTGTRAGGIYQDLFKKIEEYQKLASVPSKSELTRYKLDEDRAKELGAYKARIAGLRPSEEQNLLSARGTALGALSDVFGRTGDPEKPQGFSQVGEAIDEERNRQLAEGLAFEAAGAGIETDIYGVEGESLGRRIERERAGDPFRAVELGALQSKAEAEAARLNALMVAALTQQGGSNYYKPSNIPSIISWLNDPSNRDQITLETRQIIMNNLRQVLTGMSSEDIGELSGLMEQAQGAR
jgi:hypothetical protein